MSIESQDWDGQDRREPVHRGVRFDATINLGHILTFLGFILAGFTAWTTLDKRVTVIEERAVLQNVIDKNQDATLTNNLVSIKESLGEIKVQINRLNDRVGR
jgi:hypothetical protein